jgi:proteic killer suppression protein
MRYYGGVIRSFRCPDTARLFRRERPRAFPADLHARAYRKLVVLHAAHRLEDLRVPPGNRLEALGRDRAGQHAIRINDQWRVCFVWRDGGAERVEIVDYH